MAETASGERRDERALVDDAAARNVDERALGTERVDYGRGDEMAGLPPPLAGDPHIIAAPPQPDGIGNVLALRLRLSAAPAIEHLHPQRGAPNPHPAARAPTAQHAPRV